MTFALVTNIVLAVAIFTVIVGMLARAVRISAPRRPARAAQPVAAPVRAAQPAAARRRGYPSLARES